MADWLSYSLQDFLLFSPRVYWRFLADYFIQQTVIAVIIIVISVLLLTDRKYLAVSLYLFIAAAWFYLGWNFYLQHYAQINPLVTYLGYGCIVQALVMLVLGIYRIQFLRDKIKLKTNYQIIAMILIAPIISFIFLGQWQAGIVGVYPITTSVLTFGLLFLAKIPFRVGLSLLPVTLLLVELLTLYLVLNN